MIASSLIDEGRFRTLSKIHQHQQDGFRLVLPCPNFICLTPYPLRQTFQGSRNLPGQARCLWKVGVLEPVAGGYGFWDFHLFKKSRGCSSNQIYMIYVASPGCLSCGFFFGFFLSIREMFLLWLFLQMFKRSSFLYE